MLLGLLEWELKTFCKQKTPTGFRQQNWSQEGTGGETLLFTGGTISEELGVAQDVGENALSGHHLEVHDSGTQESQQHPFSLSNLHQDIPPPSIKDRELKTGDRRIAAEAEAEGSDGGDRAATLNLGTIPFVIFHLFILILILTTRISFHCLVSSYTHTLRDVCKQTPGGQRTAASSEGNWRRGRTLMAPRKGRMGKGPHRELEKGSNRWRDRSRRRDGRYPSLN